jgi:hypothetical protein
MVYGVLYLEYMQLIEHMQLCVPFKARVIWHRMSVERHVHPWPEARCDVQLVQYEYSMRHAAMMETV